MNPNTIAIIGKQERINHGSYIELTSKNFELQLCGISFDWIVWLKTPTTEQLNLVKPVLVCKEAKEYAVTSYS